MDILEEATVTFQATFDQINESETLTTAQIVEFYALKSLIGSKVIVADVMKTANTKVLLAVLTQDKDQKIELLLALVKELLQAARFAEIAINNISKVTEHREGCDATEYANILLERMEEAEPIVGEAVKINERIKEDPPEEA